MLRGSFGLGRWFGVEVRVHLSFAVLLALGLAYSAATTGGILRGFGLWAGLVLAVVLRELARGIAAAWSGLRLRGIYLLPVGGVMALASAEARPRGMRAMTIAGTAANLGAGLVMAGSALAVAGPWGLLEQPWLSVHHVLRSLVWLQFVVGCVNLLPMLQTPMRGLARMPRSAAGRREEQGTADAGTEAALGAGSAPAGGSAFSVGMGLALALMLAGFVMMNLWFVVLGCFGLLAARMRAGQPVAAGDADSMTVAEVMQTDFSTMASSETLSDALRSTARGVQQVFPVLRGDLLVGTVARETVAGRLSAEGDGYVQGVMSRRMPFASPGEKLGTALRRAARVGAGELVAVVEDGALVGILTPQTLPGAIAAVKGARESAGAGRPEAL